MQAALSGVASADALRVPSVGEIYGLRYGGQKTEVLSALSRPGTLLALLLLARCILPCA
jgi:hypothetical protein